jgi:ABC-type transport system involved in multi-copper enzyme maturation permease subunit
LKKSDGNRPFAGFFAIVYYEFLWNLRKKKIIGLFILILSVAFLEVALRPILAYYYGPPLENDPAFVYANASYSAFGGILLLFVAIATAMNSISGEFETGSMVPLLTKPVSRTTVFLGKITAAFLTLLGIFTIRGILLVVGGVLLRGPQDNLSVVPVGILGLTVATTVWASLVIFLGTLSKNSLLAALGTLGIYLGLTISGVLIAAYLGQTAILFYAPGTGALASTASCTGVTSESNAIIVLGSGTDWLGRLLVEWIIHPDIVMNYCGVRFIAGRGGGQVATFLSSDPISTVALRSLGVGLAYILALMGISWAAFRRTQILE